MGYHTEQQDSSVLGSFTVLPATLFHVVGPQAGSRGSLPVPPSRMALTTAWTPWACISLSDSSWPHRRRSQAGVATAAGLLGAPLALAVEDTWVVWKRIETNAHHNFTSLFRRCQYHHTINSGFFIIIIYVLISTCLGPPWSISSSLITMGW